MSRLYKSYEPEQVIQSSEPFILTSEHVEDYSDSFKYIEALYEEAQNQRELNRYMSECLILAENTTPYVKMQKLKALDEADTNNMSIGNKSSSNTGWFDKIMNFIKKIWGKFVEKITRWITTNNYYLEKYKDIILKKEPKIGAIQFDGAALDFNVAQNNIMKVVLMPQGTITDQTFKNLPDIGDNDQDKNNAIAKYASLFNNAFNNYQANTGEDFKAWCVEFFEGKKVANAKGEINPRELNWTDMYNFCHDANNLTNAIKNDSDTLQKQCDSVVAVIRKWYEDYKAGNKYRRNTMNTTANTRNSLNNQMKDIHVGENITSAKYPELKSFEDAVTNAQNALKNAQAGKDDTGNQLPQGTDLENNIKTKQTALDQANKALQTKKNQLIENEKKKEEELKQKKQNLNNQETQVINNPNSKRTDTESQHNSAILSTVYNKYLTEDNLTNQYNNNANRTVSTDITTGTEANNDADIDAELKKIESKAQLYISVGKDILSAKLTAFEFIYSQYMKIIRAHVESYVGQPVDSTSNKSNTSQQGTNYNNPAPQPATVATGQ